MELLLKQGWSSAYTVETVIVQVAATIVRGKGRVNFGASKQEYSLRQAQHGLKMLQDLPDNGRKSNHCILNYLIGSKLIYRMDFQVSRRLERIVRSLLP